MFSPSLIGIMIISFCFYCYLQLFSVFSGPEAIVRSLFCIENEIRCKPFSLLLCNYILLYHISD